MATQSVPKTFYIIYINIEGDKKPSDCLVADTKNILADAFLLQRHTLLPWTIIIVVTELEEHHSSWSLFWSSTRFIFFGDRKETLRSVPILLCFLTNTARELVVICRHARISMYVP